MKIHWNKQYTTIAVYAFFVLTASAGTILLMAHLGSVAAACGRLLQAIYPVFLGFALAYVLNRPIRFFKRRVFYRIATPRRPRQKLIDALSIGSVYLLFSAGFVALLAILIPHISDSLQAFAKNLPAYMQSLDAWLANISAKLPLQPAMQGQLSLPYLLDQLGTRLAALLPDLADLGINLVSKLISYAADIVLAIAISIYALMSKDLLITQLKKVIYALFPKRPADNTIALTRESNEIFGAYISNIFLEAFIIGLLHFIVLSLFGIPYAPLISVLLGVTDLIPYIGPVIGGGIGILLLFVVSPGYALTFFMITVCLQQLEAHLLAPKILGDSTGLTKFWVVFALLLGGGLFGIVGTILGIPLFAVLYSILRQIIHVRLRRRNLSTRSEDYRSEMHP